MILARYILRAHIGPFLFANVTIVFLFLLQFLMKTAGDLVGKGLSLWVIAELIALNLAWMLVLSVPMSVLVATLMAFGNLSSMNEIVIMRTSGMSLYRMMAPVLFAVSLLTAGLILFNNDVLPEANIRLRTLMSDVLRIKPTLSLRAGIFSTNDELPNYRILVRKTYQENNNLEGITIYDLSRPEKSVVVTAERGVVSFSPDFSKLIMDLQEGEIHEMNSTTRINYRRLRFRRHRVSIPAEGFGFSRSDAEKAQRDDRTMSSAAMRILVDSIRVVRSEKLQSLEAQLASSLRRGSPVDGQGPDGITPVPREEIASRKNPTGRSPARMATPRLQPVSADTMNVERTAVVRALDRARQVQTAIAARLSSMEYDEQQIDKYLVEIYKKYSIPFACLVFVLIGVPLGIMARRGGFGIGAGLSLGFFLLYWACLIGGEKLADRDITSPFIGMWIANIIIGFLGILLTVRSARETLVIDWKALGRWIPRRWRVEDGSRPVNPYES